jgi:uracil phosphoribosyltransferase
VPNPVPILIIRTPDPTLINFAFFPVLRDVKERGRDIEGCIKQWFSFVKPNFIKYVEPQQEVADIIVPRGIENVVAIDMVSDRIHKLLDSKSMSHREHLSELTEHARNLAKRVSRSPNVMLLPPTPQVTGITTLLLRPTTNREDFIFYTDRLASMLLERAISYVGYAPHAITTPKGETYSGLEPAGEVMATILLRGGGVLEAALNRTIPSCRIGRVLIQSADEKEREPALHYHSLPPYELRHPEPTQSQSVASPISGSATHAIQVTSKAAPENPQGKKAKVSSVSGSSSQAIQSSADMASRPGDTSVTAATAHAVPKVRPLMLLVDAEMDSGAAALMAVRVLLDHGVPEDRIVYVVLRAGEAGLRRLLSVYPDVRVVLAAFGGEGEGRWLEKKYIGC